MRWSGRRDRGYRGAAAGIAALGIDRVYASALPLGMGWTNAAHGQLPLPGPGVLELLAARGAPTRPGARPGGTGKRRQGRRFWRITRRLNNRR